MIRIQLDGEERQLSYEEFIRAIQEGIVTAETPVLSEVLTAGVWKPAAQLRFFRAWAPKGTLPPEREAVVPDEGPRAGPPPEEEPPEPPEPERQEAGESWEAMPGQPEAPGTAGGPGDAVPPETIPWEQIERIGVVAAFYGTIWLALRNTEEFFRRIARGHAFVPAVAFGLLVFGLAAVFEAIYGALTITWMGDTLEELYTQFPGLIGEEGVATAREVVFTHGLRVLFFPAAIVLWSGMIHLVLRLFGRAGDGFIVTFRVANYAMAPLVISIVPMCGSIVGWIWAIVLMIWGLRRVQHATIGLSVLAVVLPIVVFLCLWSASLVGSMGNTVSGLGGVV